jgi:hypothetical protein
LSGAQDVPRAGALDDRGDPGAIRSRLLLLTLAGAIASFALALGIRGLGRALLDVPTSLPTLVISALVPASIAPILGNSFGFLMSFLVKPGRHSMRVFLAVGCAFLVIGCVIAAVNMPSSASAGSIVTTAVVVIVPNLWISALLFLIPRPRLSD